MRGNTIEIVLSHGRIGQTRGLFQYDRGQKLLIKGEVPGVYAVHFSNQELGTSKTTIAQGNLALIPDEYLQSGEDIHLWVVVTGEDHSETEYHGVINVIPRAQPSDLEPEWEEASVIEQAIEALNTATAATASAMSTIEDTVHSVVREAIDSGEFDGFTPTITIEQQGEDTTITVVGKDDIQSATIHQNDPLSIIDDTAGKGVTNKVWSADKTYNQLDAKAPKLAPNFTGSVSMNRAGGYAIGAGSTALGMEVAASGENSFAEGYNTVASKPNQHVGGKFNVEDTQSGGKYAEIIGNGTAANRRSNARALDWQGNEYLAGDVYVNCGSNSTGGEKLQTAGEVAAMITDAIRDISSFDVQIVEELPSNKNSHTIYFVPSEDSDLGNLYNEYMWINNKWEMVGGTGVEIDISGKADKTDTVLNTTLSRGRKTNTSVGNASIAFGNVVEASGNYSFATGNHTVASGTYARAEGSSTVASGPYSHADGSGTKADGNMSHASGMNTVANGAFSKVHGTYNVPDNYSSWPEWTANTLYVVGAKAKIPVLVDGETVYRGYICNTQNSDSEFDFNKWNRDTKMNYASIVGNGTSGTNKSNAYSLDWDGNGHFAGDVYVGCNPDGTGGTKLGAGSQIDFATDEEIQDIISDWGVGA